MVDLPVSMLPSGIALRTVRKQTKKTAAKIMAPGDGTLLTKRLKQKKVVLRR